MKTLFTQAEVARRAGVSQNTVSLALRGDPRLPAATRERIRRVAQAGGYRPNPFVAALMAQVRRRRPVYRSTIALLLDGVERAALSRHPSLRRALAGARKRAEERGYQLEEFWLRGGALSPDRLAGILEARGIQGVILHPDENAPEPPPLPVARLAAAVLAFLDRRLKQFHCASGAVFRHVELAAQELQRRGYRRIGLAIPQRYDAMMDGLYSAAFASLGPAAVAPLVQPDFTAEGLLLWVKRVRPDAIMVRSAEIRGWLEAAGVAVPDQIGLVHLGWHPGMRGWAGVDPQAENIGAASVDLVIEQLQANEFGLPAEPKMVLTGGSWQNGDSLGWKS